MATSKNETAVVAANDDVSVGTVLEAFDLWNKSEINKYYTQSRDELETAVNFDEVFAGTGLDESEFTFAGAGYKVLRGRDKEQLVNVPLALRAWRFSRSETGAYVICFCVTHENEQIIFTDGSTGIYRDLSRITSKRLESDFPYPFEFLKVPNGLRVSEYGLNEENRPAEDGEKVVGQGRTFYLNY